MAWFPRVVLLVMLALLVGCASTKQARSMEQSGFLGDLYPLMQKGKEGEALLVYKSPRVALIPRGTYKKMLLEPVTMWGPPAAEHSTAPQKEIQAVADMLYSLMYQSLSKDYEMVSAPGPNTLRIQAAITRADQSYVVLRAVSTIPAPMNVLALFTAERSGNRQAALRRGSQHRREDFGCANGRNTRRLRRPAGRQEASGFSFIRFLG